MTPCKHCHNTMHAIQYTTVAYIIKKSEGATPIPERPAVCLVCPICDSPDAADAKR